MRTSEQINEIATAMAKAQGALRPAIKDALNPHYQSHYADLTSVWEACRAALPEQGLSVWQDVTNDQYGIAVCTRIVHNSGQWFEFGPLVVPLAKQDAHGVGSATSYAKRYALSAAVGVVAEEDDDGNAATRADTSTPTAHRDVIREQPCSNGPPKPEDGTTGLPIRPIGQFGYGKKYVHMPWNVIDSSTLEWFRDQANTPPMVREKCKAELAWREADRQKADALTAAQNETDSQAPDDSDIPL